MYEEIYKKLKFTKYKKTDTCFICNGKGKVKYNVKEDCLTCDGDGKLYDEFK
jgi:DnaJ-class molecular chaperone